MPSQVAPEIAIQLGPDLRHIRYDLNAMELFEELTGHGLLAINKETARFLATAKGTKALLWACLVHEDPELTVAQVGKLIHPGNFAAIDEAIKRAYAAGMPEQDDDDDPPVDRLPAG